MARTMESAPNFFLTLFALITCTVSTLACSMDNTGKAENDTSTPPNQIQGYYKVLSAADTDQIVGENKAGRQLVLKLAGVLPFSKWPADARTKNKAHIDQGRRFMEEWIVGKNVYFEPATGVSQFGNEPIAGYLYRFTHGPSPILKTWDRTTPSQNAKWGGYNLNALLIERGFTVRSDDKEVQIKKDADIPNAGHIENSIFAAEKYAEENKAGLWKIPHLGTLLTDQDAK
jgi:hypothetical protein